LLPAASAPLREAAARPQAFALEPCRVEDFEKKINELRCGTYHVYENRKTRQGRMLPLKVILLPPREGPSQGVVYVFAGGPGEAATEYAKWLPLSWENKHHDVVIIDPRGTGEGHRLDCKPPTPDSLQERLLTSNDFYEQCATELSKNADLTQYSTAAAVQDVDEIRQALGHDQIIVRGGSYGSRAAMAYIKMFGQHVSRAILTGIFPFENRVSLDAVEDNRNALDAVFGDCARDPACKAAFPDPQDDFNVVRQRLRHEPARVTIKHPDTGQPEVLSLTDRRFGIMIVNRLGSIEAGRTIPLMLKRARAGDFEQMVQGLFPQRTGGAAASSPGGYAWGLYHSVICSEDVPRFSMRDIERATSRAIGGGAEHAYEKKIVCKNWPKTHLPADYFKPFRSDVPTLLISGDLDPVTPPRWGEIARRSLPNSVHLIIPAAHSLPRVPCIGIIAQEFMRTGNVNNLDASCIGQMTRPPFAMPASETSGQVR
jgi:pimeloyl-ACP methyl ester carboxylesterase